MKATVINLIRGACIGVANIIPGVSGGTVALVLGVFARLVRAIRRLDAGLLRDALRLVTSGFRAQETNTLIARLRRADVYFLGTLLVGAGVAIVLLSRVMELLLTKVHDPTYAFFDGLILASLVVPWRLLTRKKFPEVVSFLVGLAFILALSIGFGQRADSKLEIEAQYESATETQTEPEGPVTETVDWEYDPPRDPATLFVLFLTGMIAISAMILPGVSGSFVMLVMGQYERVLAAINNRDLVVIGTVAVGCGIGLVAFTRLLHWLLGRFYTQTIAFLIGLMVGSFWTLWPFKKMIEVGGEWHHSSINVLPEPNANLAWSVAAFAVGFAIVATFDVVERRMRSAR
jgi:putative membrane protein